MAYPTVADLRPRAAQNPAQGTRWPDIYLSGGSGTGPVTDAQLNALIADAIVYIERRAGSAFTPTTYTYDVNTPPYYGLFIEDGPRPDGFGRGGKWLDLTAPVQTVNAVYLIPILGTPVLFPAQNYRVHTSLTTTAGYNRSGFDALELIGTQADSSVTPYFANVGATSSWPTWGRGVGIDGVMGWSAPPEPVARAVGLIVAAWGLPRTTSPKAKTSRSGAVTTEYSTDDSGIPEVEHTLEVFGRGEAAWEVV